MTHVDTHRNLNRWADIVALVAGVALIATSIWPTDFTADRDAPNEAIDPGLLVPLHIATGAAAILGVVLAQRADRRGLARLLLIGTAVVLLVGLFLFRDFGLRAIVTVLLPAIALFVTAFGVGPMPVNED
jgi:hypothetical protein